VLKKYEDQYDKLKVLHRVMEKSNILHTKHFRTLTGQVTPGHIMCRNYLLKHVMEGRVIRYGKT